MYKINLEIKRLPEGPYLGTSPDLPGLVVQRNSLQEVLSLAPDVAHDLIAVMVETHPGDIPAGTLRAILKGLGISPDDVLSR